MIRKTLATLMVILLLVPIIVSPVSFANNDTTQPTSIVEARRQAYSQSRILQLEPQYYTSDFVYAAAAAILTNDTLPYLVSAFIYAAAGQVFVASEPRQGYPLDGDSYVVMSTGYAIDVFAGDPTVFISSWLGGPTGVHPVLPIPAYDVAYFGIELQIPNGVEKLYVKWKFGTEEIPTWIGSPYMDFFQIILIDPAGIWHDVTLLPNGEIPYVDTVVGYANIPGGSSIDPLPPFPIPADVALNSVTSAGPLNEPFIPFTAVIDVSQFQNQTVTVLFIIGDAGDGIYDSAVFLDELGFGNPTVDYTYTPKYPVPNETVIFKAIVPSEIKNKYQQLTYHWYFNTTEPKTTTSEKINHTFKKPGKYKVTLKVYGTTPTGEELVGVVSKNIKVGCSEEAEQAFIKLVSWFEAVREYTQNGAVVPQIVSDVVNKYNDLLNQLSQQEKVYVEAYLLVLAAREVSQAYENLIANAPIPEVTRDDANEIIACFESFEKSNENLLIISETYNIKLEKAGSQSILIVYEQTTGDTAIIPVTKTTINFYIIQYNIYDLEVTYGEGLGTYYIGTRPIIFPHTIHVKYVFGELGPFHYGKLYLGSASQQYTDKPVPVGISSSSIIKGDWAVSAEASLTIGLEGLLEAAGVLDDIMDTVGSIPILGQIIEAILSLEVTPLTAKGTLNMKGFNPGSVDVLFGHKFNVGGLEGQASVKMLDATTNTLEKLGLGAATLIVNDVVASVSFVPVLGDIAYGLMLDLYQSYPENVAKDIYVSFGYEVAQTLPDNFMGDFFQKYTKIPLFVEGGLKAGVAMDINVKDPTILILPVGVSGDLGLAIQIPIPSIPVIQFKVKTGLEAPIAQFTISDPSPPMSVRIETSNPEFLDMDNDGLVNKLVIPATIESNSTGYHRLVFLVYNGYTPVYGEIIDKHLEASKISNVLLSIPAWALQGIEPGALLRIEAIIVGPGGVVKLGPIGTITVPENLEQSNFNVEYNWNFVDKDNDGLYEALRVAVVNSQTPYNATLTLFGADYTFVYENSTNTSELLIEIPSRDLLLASNKTIIVSLFVYNDTALFASDTWTININPESLDTETPIVVGVEPANTTDPAVLVYLYSPSSQTVNITVRYIVGNVIDEEIVEAFIPAGGSTVTIPLKESLFIWNNEDTVTIKRIELSTNTRTIYIHRKPTTLTVNVTPPVQVNEVTYEFNDNNMLVDISLLPLETLEASIYVKLVSWDGKSTYFVENTRLTGLVESRILANVPLNGITERNAAYLLIIVLGPDGVIGLKNITINAAPPLVAGTIETTLGGQTYSNIIPILIMLAGILALLPAWRSHRTWRSVHL